MKRALVIGGGGFIGTNLVQSLKDNGWYVVAIDVHKPLFTESVADEFLVADARYCDFNNLSQYDRVYQLAADMGGAGFVFTGDNDAEILSSSVAININLLQQAKDKQAKGVFFYSSSVCIYGPEVTKHKATEAEAYPAIADSNYGWEKLYSERLYEAYGRNYGLDIRIARFNNTYGPQGVFEGGREKSPAAICRKVIQANPNIQIWGDGKQIREFVYIDDLLAAIEILIRSNVKTPVNIGPDDSVSINELLDIALGARNEPEKTFMVNYIDGPIGLQVRHTSNEVIKSLGWYPQVSLKDGIQKTYNWIKGQMK